MTYQEAFEKIKALFDNADTSNATEHFAIQIVLTDEDCGGILYAAFQNGNLEVAPYDYQDHDTNVIVSLGDLTKILSGRLSLARALENGVLRIEGDSANLEQLKKMVRKPPAKKTAAKKAAPVKADEKKAVEKKAPAPKTTARKTAPKKTAAKKAEDSVTKTIK